MGGLKGTGEELRAEEGKVVMDGEDLGFCVKMVNGTHLHTAGGYAEGGGLDPLECLDEGGGGAGEPNKCVSPIWHPSTLNMSVCTLKLSVDSYKILYASLIGL